MDRLPLDRPDSHKKLFEATTHLELAKAKLLKLFDEFDGQILAFDKLKGEVTGVPVNRPYGYPLQHYETHYRGN
ncbi:hypothetical protein JCM5353_004042 [Sporobolomyces roseus]